MGSGADKPVDGSGSSQPPTPAGGLNWEAVGQPLLRALLASANHPSDARSLRREFKHLEHIGAADDELTVLALAAAEILGYGRVKRSLWDKVVPVLVAQWLPSDQARASRDALVRTSLGVLRGRLKHPRTTAEQLALLERARRSRPENFQTNVIGEFQRAYRRPRRRYGTTRTPTEPTISDLLLRGQAAESVRQPYEHVKKAWAELDRLAAGGHPLRAMVHLPTGAGKTDVAVGWILSRMQADPDMKVIWLAHQVALLDQAAERFASAARECDTSFQRRLHLFSLGRAPISQFHPDYTDVACITRQTLTLGLDRWMSRHWRDARRFLRRRVIVVIDEAHHVAAATYQLFLEMLGDKHDLVGLSATPWGPGYKQDIIDSWFPDVAIKRSREELQKSGVLARFKPRPIPTGVRPTGTPPERLQARRLGDLTGAILSKLDIPERNELIVEHYVAHAAEWGRTLIFAPTIESADHIYMLLLARGANARNVHSRSEDAIGPDLRRWLDECDQAVLVSVGMLLEGVDLPKARTAIIARPTTSPIVLNQMVGRVLRGPAAGGEATAIVRYLQDEWDNFPELLAARGPWEGPDVVPAKPSEQLPENVSEVIRAVVEYALTASGEDDRPDAEAEAAIAIGRRAIVGFYRLRDSLIPVLDNQAIPLASYIQDLLSDPDAEFVMGDEPGPVPLSMHLDRLRTEIVMTSTPPPLIQTDLELAPMGVAEQLQRTSGKSLAQNEKLMRAAYDTDEVAQAIYPTYELFAVAVGRAQNELRRASRSPESRFEDDASLPLLPRVPERSLDDAISLIERELARNLLPAAYPTPDLRQMDIDWSGWITTSYLAIWREGKAVGSDVIRVNQLLCSDPKIVTDAMLAALLWHEVAHSLTRGQGHDEEFQRIEDLWPDGRRLNAELDRVVREYRVESGQTSRRPARR